MREKVRDLLMGIVSFDSCDYIMLKLEDMGFFTAPASSKYHLNYRGGLCEHSLNVVKALCELTDKMGLIWCRKESPIIVGLFHDLCKCDLYLFDSASDKYIYNKNTTLSGHGDKSVILAQTLLPLTDEEIHCIRWHMGAYDKEENWGNLGSAIEKYPTVLFTHTADMIASKITER